MSNSPLVENRLVPKPEPLSLPFIPYWILSVPPPRIIPIACRTMRNAEMVIGTSITDSPKRATLPDASLTPLANVLPCTFISSATPL